MIIDTREIWGNIDNFIEPKNIRLDEISKGNFIKSNNKIVKVNQILENSIIGYDDVEYNISDCKSIPLTEEYIKEITDFIEEKDEATGIGEYTWLENDDTSIIHIINGKYKFEDINICFSSLHEMQNIYKLAFRKELLIKL